MDKALTESIGEDFERKLANFRELSKERETVRARLHKAQGERESVKQHIYQRVCAEYETQLDKLHNTIAPLMEELARAAARIGDDIAEIDSKVGEVQDRLDEIEFRQRVGEFSGNDASGRRGPLDKELNELTQRRSALDAKMEELHSAGAIMADGNGDAAATGESVAPVDLADLAEPVDDTLGQEQPYGRRIDDTAAGREARQQPLNPPAPEGLATDSTPVAAAQEPAAAETEAPAAPEAVTAETEPAPTPIDEAPKLVDPTQWVDEVLDPTTDTAVKTDTPPATSARHTTTQDGAPVPGNNGDDRDASPEDYPVLIITKGPGSGRKLPLLPMTMTMGREHDNNIEIKDEDVARYHARISFQRGKYVLEDLESASGTWINEERVSESPLRHGDKIRVGGTEMMIAFSTKGAISAQ